MSITIGDMLKLARQMKKDAEELETLLNAAAPAFEETNFEVATSPKKKKPNFGPKKKTAHTDETAINFTDDIDVLDRKQLVALCHELGYGEADTKAKRVNTLREMVETARIRAAKGWDTPAKPKRPSFKVPAKAKCPRFKK